MNSIRWLELLCGIGAFLDIKISTAVEGVHGDMGKPFSRDDHKEGLAAPRTGLAEQGNAVNVRHGIVGYDHIEIPGIQKVERFCTCGKGLNSKPRFPLKDEP